MGSIKLRYFNRIFVPCIMAASLFSQPSRARSFIGGSDGGGGVGVRCGSKLELLDIHEAKMNGLSFVQPQSQAEAIRLTTSLLAKNYWNPNTVPVDQVIAQAETAIFQPIFLGQAVIGLSNQQVQTTYVTSLPLSQDLGNYKIANGCQLEQIAYFSDTDSSLNIVKEKWDELDWLSKSALVAHEVIYFLDRSEGLENINSSSSSTSERTRAFIGKLFSTTPPPPKSSSIPLTTHMEGNAGNGEDYFYAYTSAPGELTTVFNIISHRTSPYQIRAVFKGLTQEILLDHDHGIGNASATVEFVGELKIPTIILNLRKTPGSDPTLQAFVAQSGVLIPIDSSPLHIEVYPPEQCQPAQYVTPGKDITSQFLLNYTGTFVDEGYSYQGIHPSYTITSDGKYQFRAVTGTGWGFAVCSYVFRGKIVSVIERSADDMKNYIDFATHVINLSDDSVTLTDDVAGSLNNPDCQKLVKSYQTDIDRLKITEPGYYNSIYSELFANSFRTQTNGGGDYKDGTGMARTPSTLDELYTRQ